MNIIDISFSPIYPPNEGTSIGIYQRLKMLKEKEHMVFCVFPIFPRMKNEIEIIKNHLFNNFDGYYFFKKNDKINILNSILPYSVIRNKTNSDELKFK